MNIKSIRRGLFIFGMFPAAVLGFIVGMWTLGYDIGKTHVDTHIKQLSDV